MPFNVTRHPDTFEGKSDRSREGLDHLFDAYEADETLIQFLDEYGVEYTLT